MWAMGYGASHIAPYPKYCFFGSFEPVLSAAADCEYADTGERHNHGDR